MQNCVKNNFLSFIIYTTEQKKSMNKIYPSECCGAATGCTEKQLKS